MVSLALLAFIPFGSDGFNSFTGHAVVTSKQRADIQTQVRSFVNEMPLTKYAGDGSEICLLINMGEEIISFELFKSSNIVEVKTSYELYCENGNSFNGPEDFVIQFKDYETFLEYSANPTCSKFGKGGFAGEYFFIQSELMQKGGNPVCNDVFKKRYCKAVSHCLSLREMRLYGMDCCIEITSITQYPKVYGIWFWLAFIILLGVIALGIVYAHRYYTDMQKKHHHKKVIHKSHKELEKYVEKAVKLGHDLEKIEKHLLDIGWDKKMLKKAFRKFRKTL